MEHPGLERKLAVALEPFDAPGARWVVALSGGPDSSALLAALAPLARERGIALHAVHVDHGLDPGSPERAARAGAIAAALGVPFRLRRVEVVREPGESPEAAARRVRYEALEMERAGLGATRLITAHHREDQAETLLLRIAAGTGVAGLASIAARRGALWRPALALSRAELHRALAELSPEPVTDPANADPRVPRSRLRTSVLPRLLAGDPELVDALADLARRAASSVPRLFDAVGRASGLDRSVEPPSLERSTLEKLPAPLRPLALAALFRAAGVEPAPGAARLAPVLSALARGERVRRELMGVKLCERRGRLVLEATASPVASFSYTVSIPGEVELPELGLRFRIRRCAPESWLERGDPRRAALVFSEALAAAGARVRSRLPGDRLRPLGGPGTRKLKDLLIDRAVPASARERIPLLEVGGRIAWVPGVTIDEAFRWRGEPEVWVAEITESQPPPDAGNAPRRAGVEAPERNPA